MAYRQDWVRLIRALAPKYGIDPQAVLAVASSEGLGGGVGDGGHAFGPFQLNDAGGVITGRAGNHRAFAESPAGIEWALQQIAPSARGLHGRAAIEAIVRQFERPADPSGEIGRAAGALGQFAGGPGPAAPPTAAPPGAFAPVPRSIPTHVLAAVNQSLGAPSAGESLDLPAFVSKAPGAPPPLVQPGRPGGPSATATPGNLSKWVVRSPSMDRAGVPTKPGVLQFVGQIAQLYGSPLTIGTGTNHHQYVSGENGVVSDHWFGDAADIPASGAALTRLGQDALIAAGMDPSVARKQRGGVFNVGGYNILFNTRVGGNHFNHLHVGLGRILGRHL